MPSTEHSRPGPEEGVRPQCHISGRWFDAGEILRHVPLIRIPDLNGEALDKTKSGELRYPRYVFTNTGW